MDLGSLHTEITRKYGVYQPAGKKACIEPYDKAHEPDYLFFNNFLNLEQTVWNTAWINFTKEIGAVVDECGWYPHGFSFNAPLATNKPFSITLSGHKGGKSIAENNSPGIKLDQPYTDKSFQSYINTAMASNDACQAVAFTSCSGKILVIPCKNFVTLYDFAKKASNKEIGGLWQYIGALIKEHGANVTEIEVHTGKQYFQTVGHLHFRLMGDSELKGCKYLGSWPPKNKV